MTMKLEDYLSQFSGQAGQDQVLEEERRRVEQERMIAEQTQARQAQTTRVPGVAGLPEKVFRGVEQTGGKLLTSVVRDLSTVGQTILGGLAALEDASLYDGFYEADENGNVNPLWAPKLSHLDDFLKGVGGAAIQQGDRIRQSKNLSELGENAISGVDILKGMPGGLGAFFQDDGTAAKRTGTFIAGLALEILFDPLSYAGGAGLIGKGLQAVEKGGASAVKAVGIGARGQDIAGRVAKNLVTGNWSGGGTAIALREASQTARNTMVMLANKNADNWLGRRSADLLEGLMGPGALATNSAMKSVMARYAALKEELPKDMIKLGDTVQTLVSVIPKAYRDEARKEFAVLATAQSDEVASASLDRLTKMGIKRSTAQEVADRFHAANLRMMDIFADAKEVMPQFDIELSMYHLRKVYRTHVDKDVRQDWLDYAIKKNTSGSFQLKFTELGRNLRQTLGVMDDTWTTTGRIDGNNQIKFTGKRLAKGKVNLTDEALRVKDLNSPGGNQFPEVMIGPDGTPTTAYGSTAKDYIGPDGKDVEAIGRLTQVINNLTARIDAAPHSAVREKLVAARNKYVAQLDLLNDKADQLTGGQIDNAGTFAENAFGEGFERNLGKGRATVTKLVDGVATVADMADGSIMPKLPKRDAATLANDINAPDFSAANRYTAFQKTEGIKGELLRSEQKLVSTPMLDTETKAKFLDALEQFMAGESQSLSRVVGFRWGEGKNSIPTVEWEKRMAAVKGQTLKDVSEFTAEWGRQMGLPEKEITRLVQTTTNSIAYVPGSREFAKGVIAKDDSIKQLDLELQRAVEAGFGLTTGNMQVIADRTLDPIYDELFGVVEDFSVRAADQGAAVGQLAARAKLLTELREHKLVYTKEEIENIPELKALNIDWQPLDIYHDVVSTGAQGATKTKAVEYYIMPTNQRAIQALDRSLGDLNKGSFIAQSANLFRSAALVTDISAHATQYLGNIAMLQMMGYNDMFKNPRKFTKEMSAAFRSVMVNNDSFHEAVEAGVQISQTVLTESQRGKTARTLLTSSRFSEESGNRLDTMRNIFRTVKDVFSVGPENAARANSARIANAMGGTVDDVNVASSLVSPAAMFQMSDQMTRMYAFRDSMAHSVKQLAAVNPEVRAHIVDGGSRIDFKSMEALLEQGKLRMTADELADLRTAYKGHATNAAEIANEVALNYSDVPLVVTMASKTGVVPFVKFQYKATGRIMQFMDEKPWAFAPYYQGQRNAVDAFSTDPDEFEEQRAALSPQIRDALVIPTGNRDELGRVEMLDLSRWLPFGMYASAANGGGQDNGLTAQPNNIVSTPIFDVFSKLTQRQGMKEGQSYSAYAAQVLAETFAPAGVAPGGRRIEALAKAIEESMFMVDEDGQVIRKQPNIVDKVITGYAAIPEQVGHQLGRLNPGEFETTTATGLPPESTANRPRTTEAQAWGRMVVPGFGFSVDRDKTHEELTARYDAQISAYKQNLNKILGSIRGREPTEAERRNYANLEQRIADLEKIKLNALNSLTLGE